MSFTPNSYSVAPSLAAGPSTLVLSLKRSFLTCICLGLGSGEEQRPSVSHGLSLSVLHPCHNSRLLFLHPPSLFPLLGCKPCEDRHLTEMPTGYTHFRVQ